MSDQEEHEEVITAEDPSHDNSHLVKSHSGLAAAINRVLSGEKPPSVRLY